MANLRYYIKMFQVYKNNIDFVNSMFDILATPDVRVSADEGRMVGNIIIERNYVMKTDQYNMKVHLSGSVYQFIDNNNNGYTVSVNAAGYMNLKLVHLRKKMDSAIVKAEKLVKKQQKRLDKNAQKEDFETINSVFRVLKQKQAKVELYEGNDFGKKYRVLGSGCEMQVFVTTTSIVVVDKNTAKTRAVFNGYENVEKKAQLLKNALESRAVNKIEKTQIEQGDSNAKGPKRVIVLDENCNVVEIKPVDVINKSLENGK